MEPLNFSIPQPPHPLHVDSLTIMVHQAEALHGSEMHDTGLVLWPSAVMLSRWIANNPSVVLDRGDILELGAGCGLVGLVAASLLRQQTQEDNDKDVEGGNLTTIDEESSPFKPKKIQPNVIFTDYNTHARENIERNIQLNHLENCSSVFGLDFFDQGMGQDGASSATAPLRSCNNSKHATSWTDMDGKEHPQVNLILAADIICYSNDAELVAQTIQVALVEGGRAIVMGPDENRRFGLAFFVQACEKHGLEVNVTTLPANHASHADCIRTEGLNQSEATDLSHDLHQTSGFVNQGYDYNFHMYTVDKPTADSQESII